MMKNQTKRHRKYTKLSAIKFGDPETDNLGKGLKQTKRYARNGLLIQSCWLPGYHKPVAKNSSEHVSKTKEMHSQSVILMN